MHYLFANEPHHERAERFGIALAQQSQTEITVSAILWLEFLHVIRGEDFRVRLDPEVRARFGLDDWEQAPIREAYVTAQMGVLDAFLSQFHWSEVSLSSDVRRAAVQMAINYNLDSHDAAHLASMDANQVIDLASFDRKFRRVDGLHLWNDQVHS